MADIIFTSLFTLEMSLKLTALGFQYVMDGWNLLDAFVVFEVMSFAQQQHSSLADFEKRFAEGFSTIYLLSGPGFVLEGGDEVCQTLDVFLLGRTHTTSIRNTVLSPSMESRL